MVERAVAEALGLSFLGRLPAGVVNRLADEGERTDYPSRATIYREGAAARSLLVLDGLVRVYMASAEGRQVTVRYARRADVLGIAVMVGGPANVVVETLAPSSLFSINLRILSEAASHDPQVAWAIAEELNRRLYETLRHVAINSFGTVKQRIAAHLLELGAGQSGSTGLIAQTSQQELADAVGSVREVVARVLRDLRQAGIVATSPDSVLILDRVELQNESWDAPTA